MKKWTIIISPHFIDHFFSFSSFFDSTNIKIVITNDLIIFNLKISSKAPSKKKKHQLIETKKKLAKCSVSKKVC